MNSGSRFKKVLAFGRVIFEIMGVRESDAGRYCCIARNRAGQAEAAFTLNHVQAATPQTPKFTAQPQVVQGKFR